MDRRTFLTTATAAAASPVFGDFGDYFVPVPSDPQPFNVVPVLVGPQWHTDHESRMHWHTPGIVGESQSHYRGPKHLCPFCV